MPPRIPVYQKVFDGLRKFMLHSMMKMGGNKKRLDTLKRVYRVTPQSAITAVLRLGSGTKVLIARVGNGLHTRLTHSLAPQVMTGFAGLLLQKIGSYTLLQRLLYSRLDIDAIEAQRDQCVQVRSVALKYSAVDCKSTGSGCIFTARLLRHRSQTYR